MTVQEGDIEAPGGVLRYRLAGPATAARTVVFENGWSASHRYAHWLEQALATQVRALTYDRAGIGYSRATQPLTVAGMTAQLRALLAALDIREPVVIAGHSYGGLIAALHAAQAPELVSAIVQIDPTPEFDDPVIDPSLRIVPALARVMQLLALLRIDGALHAELKRDLPAEAMQSLLPGAGWQLRSLAWAIDEIRLLPEMRRVIAASASGNCRRLVISADAPFPPASALKRWLKQDVKERGFRAAAHAVHRHQAGQTIAGRWATLPYTHVGMVTRRECAQRVAAMVFDFIAQGNT